MRYKFSDIVDIPTIQKLMESLWKASGIPTGIIDIDGTVLVAAGWQDICTDFHRQHPETSAHCLESDTYFAKRLQGGDGLPECGYIEYRCQNGMIDIGIPIEIEGHHLANIVLGQFFYGPPEEGFFRQQARRFGFDEEAYLGALRKVPIFSRQKVNEILEFNSGLVDLLSRMGVDKLRQLEAQRALKDSEEKFRNLFERSNDAVYIVEPGGRILEANRAACMQFDFSRQELLQKTMPELLAPGFAGNFANRVQEIQHKGGLIFETAYRRKDGSRFPVEVSARPFVYRGQPALVGIARDISERKQAEEQQRESERRFTTLVANLSGMVYRCRNDRNWTMEFVSEGGLALTGYAAEELIDNRTISYSELIHPEDREEVWRQIQAALPKERFVLEYRIITAGGEERWVMEQGQGVFAESGSLLALEGFVTDITDRKKAEKELQNSERRLRTLIDAVPSILFVKNAEGRFLAANKAAAAPFGMEADELVGRLHADVHPDPAQMALIQEDDRRAFALKTTSEPHVVQGSYLNPSGARRWLQITKVPCPESIFGEPAIVGSATDITELILAEEALKKALGEAEATREKIETILKSVADGLIFTDMDGRIVLMSASAEQILAKQLHEVFLQPLQAVIENSSLKEELAAICAGQKAEALLVMELPPEADGETRTFQTKSSLVSGRDGRKAGVITLLRDVSRERQLDRIKREFIATAAHELRTPLTAVMGFSELLLTNRDLDPKQQAEYLSIIHKKSEVLGKIVADFLDLARVDSGKVIRLKQGWADLGSIIGRCTADFQTTCPGHRFETVLPDKPVIAFVDDRKLFQVMENLLSNAVKFSPVGGLIRASCEMDTANLRIAVRDEGGGMTSAQVEKVFDKFYRADASNTAKEGLGLGMAIVKCIVEAHGGQIWVDSELGKGTTVTFDLPYEG